jgi:protein-disulfide isomerase
VNISRRRFAASSLLFGATSPFLVRKSSAQDDRLYPLKDDGGRPIANYKLPSELSTVDLPGLVWTGSEESDVVLIEFFDYNCPFCRRAVGDLDAILKQDKNVRLGLINNAILSVGSVQAAKVQQGVLKGYGVKRAYEFHDRMFANHGQNDGASALRVVKSMGLDVARVETLADGEDVGAVLLRQVKLAESLGFAATPSFIMDGVGILGYPGPRALARMIAAVRQCDQPYCA